MTPDIQPLTPEALEATRLRFQRLAKLAPVSRDVWELLATIDLLAAAGESLIAAPEGSEQYEQARSLVQSYTCTPNNP
jgi:hypothetical protein